MSYNILYSTLANARKSHRVISSISTTCILEGSVLKRRHGLIDNSLQYNVKSYFVNIHHLLAYSLNERYLHSTITGGFCFKGVEEKNQTCKQVSLPTTCYYRNFLVNENKSTQSSNRNEIDNNEKIEKINTTFVKPRNYSRSRLQNLVWTQLKNETVSNKNFVTKTIHETDGKLGKEMLNKNCFNESHEADLKSKLAATEIKDFQFSSNFPSETFLTVDIVPGFKDEVNVSSPCLKFESFSGQNKNKSYVNLIKTTKINDAQKSKSDKEISINACHNKVKNYIEPHLIKNQAIFEGVNVLRNKNQSHSSPNLLLKSNDEFVPQIKQKSNKKLKYNESFNDVEISKMEFSETPKTINSEKTNEVFRTGVEKPMQRIIVCPPLPSKRRPSMDLVNIMADEINLKNKIDTFCNQIDLKLHATAGINRILRPVMPNVKVSKKTDGLSREEHNSSILSSFDFKTNVNNFFYNSNNIQIKPHNNSKMLLDNKLMGTSFDNDPLQILDNKYNSSRNTIVDKNGLLKNISSSKSKKREITLGLKSHIKTWKIYQERRKTTQESVSQLYKSISRQKKLNITKKNVFLIKIKERKKCSVIAIPINPPLDINKQFHKTMHTKVILDRKKKNHKIIPFKADPTEIMRKKHNKGWNNYKNSFKDIMKEKKASILMEKFMEKDEAELVDDHQVIDEKDRIQKNCRVIRKPKGRIQLNVENLQKETEKQLKNLSNNIKKITALSEEAMPTNTEKSDTDHKEGSLTVKEVNTYPSGYRKIPEFRIELLSMNKNEDKKLADKKNTDSQINKHPNIDEKASDIEALCKSKLDKHDNIVLDKTSYCSLQDIKNGFKDICKCKSNNVITQNKVVNSFHKLKSNPEQTKGFEAVCKSKSEKDNNMVLNAVVNSSLQNQKCENKIMPIVCSEISEKQDEQCNTDLYEVTHNLNDGIKKLEGELERLKKLMAFNKNHKVTSIASEKKIIPNIHCKLSNSPLDNEHCPFFEINFDAENLPMSREDKLLSENRQTEKSNKKNIKVCSSSDINNGEKNEIFFGLSDRNRQSEKVQSYYNEQREKSTPIDCNIDNKMGLMKKNEKGEIIDGSEPNTCSNNQIINCQFSKIEGMVDGKPRTRTMKEENHPPNVEVSSSVTRTLKDKMIKLKDSTQQGMTTTTCKKHLSQSPPSKCNREVDQIHHYANKECPQILSKILETVDDPLVHKREGESNSKQLKESRMAALKQCSDEQALLKINTLTGSPCIPGNATRKKYNKKGTMNNNNSCGLKIANSVKYYLSSMHDYLNHQSSAVKKWTKLHKFVTSNNVANHKIKQNKSILDSEISKIFCRHDPALECSNKNYKCASELNKLGFFDHELNQNKAFSNSELRQIIGVQDQAHKSNNTEIDENRPSEIKEILANNQVLGNTHKNDKSASESYQPDILQQNVYQITGEAKSKSTSDNFQKKERSKNLDSPDYNRKLLSYCPRTIKKHSEITTHTKAPALPKKQFKISKFNKQLLSHGENILGEKKNCGSFLNKAQVKGFNYCRDIKSPFYHIPKQMVLKSEKCLVEGKSAFHLKNDSKLHHITKQSIKPSKVKPSEIAEKIRLKEALNSLKNNDSRQKLPENPEAYWFDYNPQHFDIETISSSEYVDYLRKRKRPTT